MILDLLIIMRETPSFRNSTIHGYQLIIN